MHASSIENMQKCFERYVCTQRFYAKKNIKVADIGGVNINGSFRDIFSFPPFEYIAVDLNPHPKVDIVLKDPYRFPFENSSFDIVISGQLIEHVEYFWLTFSEKARILKPDGIMLIIAPSSGPIHKYPVDCYRFYPDSFKALAKREGIHLIDLWMDERGPWKDLVGVFSKNKINKFEIGHGFKQRPDHWVLNEYEKLSRPSFFTESSQNNEYNVIKGENNYLEVLEFLHTFLNPTVYLELGVRHGHSFKLAKKYAYGVDPSPELNYKVPANSNLFEVSSDLFFEFHADELFKKNKIDFALIDGMHLFEFALRDFINIEKYSTSSTVVVIDDVLPNHRKQANRVRQTKVWTGDVWKLHKCLKEYRPDLSLTVLDTKPTGLMIISGLDKENKVLVENYNYIVRRYRNLSINEYESKYINRNEVERGEFSEILKVVLKKRSDIQVNNFESNEKEPDISFIIIAFNMSRELIRTLYTLQPEYQLNMEKHQVEVIVVDNGSLESISLPEEFKNVRTIKINNPSVSPVQALNYGIRQARSDFICAMIDGARMLSPGICMYALKSKMIHPRIIVSTLGFHLGSELQMESVLNGYDKHREDTLLESVNWEEDGYRLFSISVFSGSSAQGWFSTIAESNALFMSRELWDEIGGYDENFISPGGGLVNLDTYVRACELNNTQLVVLLGEGTFHQVHGGIMTNQNRVDANWAVFHEEYRKIRGIDFKKH